jgi:hypothetical protein
MDGKYKLIALSCVDKEYLKITLNKYLHPNIFRRITMFIVQWLEISSGIESYLRIDEEEWKMKVKVQSEMKVV